MKKTIFSLLTIATVSLAAPNPPTAEDPMISITPVTRSMAQTGGAAAINTSGSGTWRASVSDNWILLTSSSGAAGYPVGYTVSANNSVETRIGYVYVSGYVHTITQAGLGATLESYSAEFESGGGTGSVRVNAPSGKTWHAASNADWIEVGTESGTGTSACAFTVAAYDEVSTRSGTLTIADNTFTVFQTGRRIKLGADGATTDYFGDTIKIRVNALADTAWSVSVDQDWLTVTDAGNGLGGDEVRIAVAENPSVNARSGTVTIGTETFAVTQLGRTALVFKISPTEVAPFGVDGASGERIAVTATPDLGWTAVSSGDWIEFTPGTASGSGNGSVVYKVQPNPTLHPRSGSITVTAANGGVAAKRLDISQAAAVASLTVESYEFDAAGETLSVGVSTGSIVEWSVAGLPDWLSVSSASMTGPGSVILAAAANTSVQPRSGTIRIADHEFHVSQKGRGVSIGYDETKVFDTDGKTTGDSTENVISVTADPDVQWTAVASAPTWIVVYEGATGTGTGTVKFIVAPYVGSGEIRTGLITIGSEIVYVTQRPYELSIEPNGTWVDGNAGAGEIQVALDIAGVWNAIATEPWIMIVSGYDAGTGNGKVLFSYTDNNTGRQRTGKIIVAGETYTLTQAARQNFAVTATAGRGGHVAGGGIYGLDAAIELEAVPEGGYAFDHWALPGGGTSTENPLAVTVTAAQSYQAVFVPADPGLVVASASLKGVKLAWADLPWATELRVFRGTSSNRSQATRIATLANDGSCEWLDATGAENQTYWYWIEAIGDEEDVWSGAVRGTRAKATFAIDYTNLRGTTHSNPATYVEGSTVSFAPPSSRTGFTFEGWTPTGITADTSGDVTVRANWEQNEYTVRFDLGGAAGSMADEPFTYGLWKYLSPTNFSRTGYTFVGWAVKPSAAAAVYDDSESVKSLTAERNETVTLYALWRRENLDDPLPDLGTSATSSDIIAVFVGTADAARLGENITSAAEYADFRAWADSVRDGSGAPAGHEGVSTSPHAWLSYALGQESLLEAAPGEGDLVILDFGVAESGASRFDLTFGLDGITVGDSAKPANLAKTFAIEGTEFLEDGFSEDAVALLSIGPSEGAVATSVEPESDADSFFFRVVERPEQTAGRYTISFNSAGGSAVAPISQEYGTAVATPAAPTRTGYTFAGWIPAVPATMPAGNRTLTAQWTPKQYTVSFDSAGGSAVSPISQGYTSAITPPVDPTRIGYTFAGWSPAIPATMPTTNTTCVAQWTPNHYTIRFIANGGSGAMGDLDVAYDETVSLSPVGFTGPGGAAFIGWSTTPDGLVEYIDEAEVRNLSVEDGAIIPVYAKWDRGSFTVHFDANGGTGEMPDQVFTLDVSLNLATNLFVKTNSVFVGWSTNGTDDVFFVDGESVANLVVVGETVTLRAVWAPLYCIVDLSGGADASSYPVTHPDELPVDGFNTDEYKTTKLVLRRLEPGPIPTREATITKPFFVGLFEVTQRQWELVMGTRPSYFSNDSYYATRPVERVSYDMIRGSSLGAQWPTSNVVDANSFLGKLRTRTGLDFDLPTEAQWEYACRAGTPTDYNNGKNGTTSSQDAAMDEVGRYWFNGGSAGWQNSSCSTTNGTAAAGSYLPNVWGLYDMHGNVWEWCLDWYGDSLSGTDPVGPSSGEERVMRGGAYSSWASDCVSSYRDCCPPTSVYFTRFGFRLVRSLSN